MTITAAFVLLAVTWFMTFFIVLPIGMVSQGDTGKVEPGTPASAPAGFVIKRKVWITTLIAIPLWLLISGVILSGVITVRDLDWFHRMTPIPATADR